MTSLLAQYHFAPTASARESLLAEGVAPEAVHVTGNTVVDALLAIAARDLPLPLELGSKERVLLITLHRRESFGEPLRGMLRAVRQVLEARPDVIGVFPVHPNPNVRAPVLEVLGTMPNARLVAPLDYGSFVALMKRATLLLSDSGGVQEEAPSLKVPLLVLREDTERPEGIQAGAAKLVGTRPERIVPAALHLLDSPQARKAMQIADNPYGDGHAAERIADILQA